MIKPFLITLISAPVSIIKYECDDFKISIEILTYFFFISSKLIENLYIFLFWLCNSFLGLVINFELRFLLEFNICEFIFELEFEFVLILFEFWARFRFTLDLKFEFCDIFEFTCDFDLKLKFEHRPKDFSLEKMCSHCFARVSLSFPINLNYF